jgi:hypothetical protein
MLRDWALAAVDAMESDEQREQRRLKSSAFYPVRVPCPHPHCVSLV